MEIINQDIWKQQWVAFMSAPFIIFPIITIVGIAVWWFRGTMLRSAISGLREQINVYDARLKLAAEQAISSDRAKDEVERQFQAYKTEVLAKADNDMLSTRIVKVEAAIRQLAVANSAVRSTLSGVLSVAEQPDIVSFHGTVGKAKE